MKLNLSEVESSKKDLLRKIRIPKILTSQLAHLVGVHLGDGSMVHNKENYDYWVSYSGNLTEEYDWYMNYLIPIIKKLFNIDCKIQEDRRIKRSMIRIYFRSKSILTFLNKTIGLPLGNKAGHTFPKTIIKAPQKIKINFLKGMGDTEFSLSFKIKGKNGRHEYPTIAYGTSSIPLAKDINSMLNHFGFDTHARFNFIAYRYNIPHIANYITLNGSRNLELWMKKVGFTSPKHLTKYKIWKKFGFCPPHTTLLERRAILNGELDVNSFYSKPL